MPLSTTVKDGGDLGVSCIKKTMPREGFQVLLRNLHLNDYSKLDPGTRDKLHKIRPLVKTLNTKFRDAEQPEKHLAVDEYMINSKDEGHWSSSIP